MPTIPVDPTNGDRDDRCRDRAQRTVPQRIGFCNTTHGYSCRDSHAAYKRHGPYEDPHEDNAERQFRGIPSSPSIAVLLRIRIYYDRSTDHDDREGYSQYALISWREAECPRLVEGGFVFVDLWPCVQGWHGRAIEGCVVSTCFPYALSPKTDHFTT
ncbi:hypothetical protein CPB85DRAFT_547930 [Mucidula mucida]|nr:hypothetical protein CPB85DRAFT_547930 [Mucidula mucida]